MIFIINLDNFQNLTNYLTHFLKNYLFIILTLWFYDFVINYHLFCREKFSKIIFLLKTPKFYQNSFNNQL